ncbi:penicillin-binding protein activator [Bowmanella dokdonensis]|uniref:Penicillin-binding protein activator n=1 Tax=Bowmanella dokdonensis TaxID=751969 RepID=A0A939DKY5_9ALTE|nr:penicillin-binding protein activator [Bowmanella dokdonensis]MBN7824080.1 penicillin-binding protein activator [Bowmanella dokdonensis]
MLTYRSLTLPMLTILLCACASAPRVSQPVPDQPRTSGPTEILPLDGDQYLARARQAEPARQLPWLLNAAQAWQNEQRCTDSLKLLQVLSEERLEQSQSDRLWLIHAECLLQLDKTELAAKSLAQVSMGAHHLPRRLALSSRLAELQQRPLDAARDLAEWISLEPALATELQSRVWALLQQVPSRELERVRDSNPYLAPWLYLARISRLPAGPELTRQLADWQQRYDLPLPDALEQLKQLDRHQPRKVAVILPLSGRLAGQGEALKEGILAAYFSRLDGSGQTQPSLTFLDSNLVGREELQGLELAYDFVIGPLLKENIDALLSAIPERIPTLVLNRLDEPRKSAGRYFYSLAPEDEAVQLAEYLAGKGYDRTLVVSSDRQVFQRMASSFANQWMKTHDSAPRQVSFTDNKSMRSAMETLLEVSASNQRINQVERLAKEEVHAFARNRRDVDAIVVFANAAQTELLNPIIESSISPFAKIVPVYASSRSFSQEMGNNSLRDLRHLTFMDMPWLLPGQESELKQLSQQLWPQRNDGQARLFAMGYDAYQLLPVLHQMALVPMLEKQGLTGSVRMDSHHQLVRQLPMARIEQERVIRLAQD